MTLLHTNFASGDLFAVGAGAGNAGISGINQITDRVNFANFDFANEGSMTFTYTNNRITQMVISGADQSYITDIRYNDGTGVMIGSVVTSGTTIGSTIVTELFSAGTQFVSGTVSLS